MTRGVLNSGAAAPLPAGHRRRILMSIDSVGGVWRYAMDLAAALRQEMEFFFVGLGPHPNSAQVEEAEAIGDLVWLDAPLDWTASDEQALDVIPRLFRDLVAEQNIDLAHLNLPSQAAGLDLPIPVLVVSHSCVVTWFAAVRRSGLPAGWAWQKRRNRAGFDAADLVIAPSMAHADLLRQSYGPIPRLEVVHNGTRHAPVPVEKDNIVFAAGRWWDEGKNGAVLDAAAALTGWPVVMAGAENGPNGQRIEIRHADFRGHLPHSKARAIMNRAAIVASPSLYEPFGLVPLEAAGARAALVLADIPTYRELWEGAALFADPENPRAFAAAIDRLAADEVLRERLAEAALRRSTRYTIMAQARSMRQLYGTLMPQTLAPSA